MSTLTWTHTDPIEGCVEVTLHHSDGMLALTKGGVPVLLNSPEGEALLRELSVLTGSTGPA